MSKKKGKQSSASKGGTARAEALSSAERRKIAADAARARWEKEDSETCSVSDSPKNRDYWISRPYVPKELQAQLAAADILLVPQEGFRERTDPVFPVGTEELFFFLKETAGVPAVDICISDNEYKELALHSDLLRLPDLVITSGALVGIVLNVLSNYIYDKIKSRKIKEVKSRIFIQNGFEKTVQIEYEGPAEGFAATVSNAAATITGQPSLPPDNSRVAKELPETTKEKA